MTDRQTDGQNYAGSSMHQLKLTVKRVKGQDTCYSAAYMSQT